jgi:hypothetical protein
VLGPGRVHAERHHDDVAADRDPVDEDRQQVDPREVAAEDLGEAGLGGAAEPAVSLTK